MTVENLTKFRNDSTFTQLHLLLVALNIEIEKLEPEFRFALRYQEGKGASCIVLDRPEENKVTDSICGLLEASKPSGNTQVATLEEKSHTDDARGLETAS